MRKVSGTERIVKDLLFLQKLDKEILAPGIIKRIESKGTGDPIKEIKSPCSIYLSLYKYDYEGRFYNQLLNVCIRDISKRTNQQIPQGVYLAVQSMRLQEKAWLNFTSPELHGVAGLPHGGCHFYIIIEQIRYKSSQNIEDKKIVSQKCRKEAKKYFQDKEYEKALKLYRRQINITEGVQKKKYKSEQLKVLQQINERAKKNLLKCFAKLKNFDETLAELAEKYSKELLKKYNDSLTMLFRCHVLKQRKYLSDALKLAEELAIMGEKQAGPLIEQLKQLIKSKN